MGLAIIAIVGAVKFIMSLTPAGKDVQLWQFVLAITIIALGIYAAYVDFMETKAEGPKLSVPVADQTSINAYMFNLLSSGGRVAIFSNDLTWVQESTKISNLLLAKAASDEVTLLLPKTNSVSKILKSKGARVLTYSSLNVTPKTRFTIVYHGNADEWVAIGRRQKGVHTIREYCKDDLPYMLAQDLFSILSSCAEKHP